MMRWEWRIRPIRGPLSQGPEKREENILSIGRSLYKSIGEPQGETREGRHENHDDQDGHEPSPGGGDDK